MRNDYPGMITFTGKQLIRDMMQVNPAARITARQVRDDVWITVLILYIRNRLHNSNADLSWLLIETLQL